MPTYDDGIREGKRQMAERFLDVAANILGTNTDSELAGWIGASPVSIGQWRSGSASPHKRALNKVLDFLMAGFVDPEMEIEPIYPMKRGSGWVVDRDRSRRQKIKDRIEHRVGVYLFYDTLGQVTYVGQTGSNLFFEIEQRLAQTLRHGAFIRRPRQSKLKSTDLIQGNVVRYVSAYVTHTSQAAHNLEAVLIRAFYNNHRNRKSAKIKLGEDWEA